jgi:tetratricopeptide (TPR) repeat protein
LIQTLNLGKNPVSLVSVRKSQITKTNRLTISPMLDKIWRFLKQLIRRLFGTNPKIEPTPPQPAPTLTDAEYEAKLMELLEGVNQGWGRGDVAEFLIAKRIKNGDLVAWLGRFGDRLLEGAQGSTASADAVVSLQELARRLELLGRVAGGELGEVAGNVGREILVEFPLVSVGGGEDVDGEAEAWYDRGNEQYNLGDFEGAIISYDKALKIQPDYHKAWYFRGIGLRKLGRLEEAITSYDKALEFKPDYHFSWHHLGYTLAILGRLEEAITSYDKALEFKPDNDGAWSNRGAVLVILGRPKEAIISFDKALEFKPDNNLAWNNRGNALFDLGRLKDAIASYDKALEFKPDKHDAWNNRGLALYNLGRLEDAIASYDKALEFKPDDYDTWFNRGIALHDLGRLEDAIASYDKALEIQPDDHRAWFNRGNTLRDLGRLEDAIASYDKALQIKPDKDEAWNNRGVALYKLRRLEDAIASYDKALQIKPDQDEAWYGRGIAVSNAPGYNQLVYEILQGQFPNSPPVTRTLITHNLKQRGYEGQISTLKAGLEYCQQNTHPEGYGKLHQALGDAHYSRGKLNSPKTYWNKATASYNEALKTLTKDTFLQLHLEVLQDLIKTLVSLKKTEQANKLQRDATDLLQRLLKQQNYSQLTQQQLTDKLVSFEQLTVNIFIQSGQFSQALATAETDKNVCLSWLLDALPIPDYETEETVTHAQIQQLLNPTTCAIYWHLSDASLTTFIIKSDGLLSPETCFSDFPDEFEEWVKEWNQQYTDYQSKEKTSQVNHPWRGGMASKFARLNAILKIDAIEQQLEGITELILIPHRDLHRFPIHALFSRDFVVSYLPSAAVGISLQHRFTPPNPPLAKGGG